MKSLVLIVGAGASCEVGLPSGAQLRERIRGALDIRFEVFSRRPNSGCHEVFDALDRLAGSDPQLKGNVNALLDVCWQIRDAMPQAISIDNYIDSHRENTWIARIGKIAIVRCILEAESGSHLMFDQGDSRKKLNFLAVEGTWFAAFFRMLHEGCNFEQFTKRVQSIGIITFNYDRCIEHYLFNAIKNYYNVDDAKAAQATALLEIHHPYGMVGALRMAGNNGTRFGADGHQDTLLQLAGGLRTFTEGADPSTSNIESIRTLLRCAERIAFLGFAYHPLNMQLLFGAEPSSETRMPTVFGTAVSMSPSDCEQVAAELKSFIQARHVALRHDLRCAGLLAEYSRSLSLR